MTTDEQHWTPTCFTMVQESGDATIISWNVDGSSSGLWILKHWKQAGAVFMGADIIALLFLFGLVVLIVWLGRRSNRKKNNAGIS